MKSLASLLCILVLSACASTSRGPVEESLAPEHQLAGWMTGSFTSAAQAKIDPENFFPVRMVMLPIWTDRADGPWLYVEQAAEARLEKPYRQRVYNLIADENGDVRSDVYALPGDLLKHAGCWNAQNPLQGVTPENLVLREGCTIYLERGDIGSFEGSTRGKGCVSKLGNAAYATSEVTIRNGLLTSWDRGFDKDGKQVWGATEGPYRFVRTSIEAPSK